MGEMPSGEIYFGKSHAPDFVESVPHESVRAGAVLKYQRKDIFSKLDLIGYNNGDAKLLEENFGVLVAPKNARDQGFETTQLTRSLKTYGRSDFIPFGVVANDGTRFSVIYRRGVLATSDVKPGDLNSDSFGTRSRLGSGGLADEKTTIAEQENMALDLHKDGIRVRLPIMGFRIDSVLTKDGVKTVEDLVAIGAINRSYLENRPMVSYWARRSPYTFRDAFEVSDVRSFMKDQLQVMENENTNLSKKVIEAIETDEVKGLGVWSEWLVTVGAEQMSRYSKKGYIHPSFTDQNMTVAIESGDSGDDSETFSFSPLTKESSAKDKENFGIQTCKMLFFATELREKLNSKLGSEVHDGLSDMVSIYLRELSTRDNAMILMKSMLSLLGDRDLSKLGCDNMQTNLIPILRAKLVWYLGVGMVKRWTGRNE